MFNLFFVLFNLLSLLLFIPFLNLLFGLSKAPKSAADQGLSMDYLEVKFAEIMGGYVDGGDKLQVLGFICVIIIVLFLLKNLFRFLAMVAVSHLRQGIARDIRKDVYDKLLALPLSYFSDERKGDVLSRSTADVLAVEISIIGSLEMLVRDPLNVILSLGTMFLISPQLTLFSLVLLPISGFVISRISKSLRRTSLKGQDAQGDLLSFLEESLGGLRIIKAFNAERQMKGGFAKINDQVKRLITKVNIKRELASPVSEFLGACVMVGIVWYGGRLILTEGDFDSLTGSQFIGFIIMFSNLLRPVQNISKVVADIGRGSASVDRVNAILKADNKIEEQARPESIGVFNNKIEYDSVGFAYEEEPVLTDISFNLEKGQSLALVGESGGGKSTIADLLPRFYDVNSGSIRIDGIDLKDAKLNDVRGLMGIVTQQSILFNDTVYNNIAFGMDNVTLEQVTAAAKVANAHDFIEQMSAGYQTNIGDGGNKLSGGQKQRLSIARAVLKNPPILILDEATSALDTESEKLVQDALVNLMKDRTSLIIAHRLSTIQHVDEILVLQKGKIVERGAHADLIARGGVYKRLCDLQGFT